MAWVPVFAHNLPLYIQECHLIGILQVVVAGDCNARVRQCLTFDKLQTAGGLFVYWFSRTIVLLRGSDTEIEEMLAHDLWLCRKILLWVRSGFPPPMQSLDQGAGMVGGEPVILVDDLREPG
jgi:hypothetical protein